MEVICTSRSRYIDYIDPNHVPQTLWRWFQLPGHHGSQAPHRYVAWWNRKAYGICSVCSVCLEKAVEVCPFQEKTVSSVEMSCIACIPCCHVASDELPAASSSFQAQAERQSFRGAGYSAGRSAGWRQSWPGIMMRHDETWRDPTWGYAMPLWLSYAGPCFFLMFLATWCGLCGYSIWTCGMRPRIASKTNIAKSALRFSDLRFSSHSWEFKESSRSRFIISVRFLQPEWNQWTRDRIIEFFPKRQSGSVLLHNNLWPQWEEFAVSVCYGW